MENLTDHFVMVKHKKPVFRLWAEPAFDEVIAWTLYVDAAGWREYKHPMVRRVVKPAFTIFPPHEFVLYHEAMQQETIGSFDVQEYFLSRTQFEHLDVFRSFTLPLVFDDSDGGLDGCYYGFQSWSYPTDVALKWWMDEPSEWHELIEWASRCLAYFENLFAKQQQAAKDINQLFSPDTKFWRYVEQ